MHTTCVEHFASMLKTMMWRDFSLHVDAVRYSKRFNANKWTPLDHSARSAAVTPRHTYMMQACQSWRARIRRSRPTFHQFSISSSTHWQTYQLCCSLRVRWTFRLCAVYLNIARRSGTCNTTSADLMIIRASRDSNTRHSVNEMSSSSMRCTRVRCSALILFSSCRRKESWSRDRTVQSWSFCVHSLAKLQHFCDTWLFVCPQIRGAIQSPFHQIAQFLFESRPLLCYPVFQGFMSPATTSLLKS